MFISFSHILVIFILYSVLVTEKSFDFSKNVSSLNFVSNIFYLILFKIILNISITLVKLISDKIDEF